MAPIISITLPSIYPDDLARTLANIRDMTKCAYQVVVVSPFEPPVIKVEHGEITWVHETHRAGSNAGHAKAFAHVTGAFVTPFVDDHAYTANWDVQAVAEVRTLEVHSWRWAGPVVLGLRQTGLPRQVGTVFGQYYPYFPFMRRETAQQIGWYDPAFFEDFGDCDLGMRAHQAGARVVWARTPCIDILPADRRKGGRPVNGDDMRLFLQRWSSTYGKGWPTGNLRDFNMDFDLDAPEFLDRRLLWDGNTIVPRHSVGI